jgi:hypothetical protein
LRPWLITALLIGLPACSNAYDSALLKVRYAPPSGVKLSTEEAGPPAVARFSQGIELRAVAATPPVPDEAHFDALLDQLREGAKVAAPGKLSSARPGSLPIGPVVRLEVKGEGTRSLVYFVPLEGRYLVLSLTAPEARYGMLEALVERSLSSLEARP